MNQFDSKLAVQSWSLRKFNTHHAVIQEVQTIGVKRIELCSHHVNFSDDSQFDAVIGSYVAAGIQIASIGIQTFSGNAALEEKWFQFAAKAGAKHIGVSFGIDQHLETIKTIEMLAEKYDVVAGIHNHGGSDWLSSPEALQYIFKRAGKRLGLELDTAWALQAGTNPLRMAEQFSDRLHAIHLKDFVFDRSGKVLDVVLGRGSLDLKNLLSLLAAQAPADLIAIVEYEGLEENPTPAIRECVAAIRACL